MIYSFLLKTTDEMRSTDCDHTLAAAASKPNILFILTDDQGKQQVGGLEHMPALQKHLVQKGTTYDSHFCSTAVCCPSRANLWTGRMPHNTNITDVGMPYGGYQRVVEAGWNDRNVFVYLQEAGYEVNYIGKLYNAHTEQNYNKPYARGFNNSEFLLDPYTYRYYNARMTRNGEEPVDYSGQYSTDLLSHKAMGFLNESLKSPDQPWFLTVAPNAPHSNGSATADGTHWFGDPEFAPRHAGLFKDYKIPRDESFNTLIQGAVGWTADLKKLSQKEVDYMDEFQRKRLRALRAVDEMVDALVTRLEDAGQLDNTYVIYSTDNGYHVGQHAMRPGKNCGYDTDTNIPLIIRGPGVAGNTTIDVVSSHTDLAPTFLDIAGAPTRDGLDGRSILNIDTGAKKKTEHASIEYWGLAVPEGIYGYISNQTDQPENAYEGNTYKSLRLISDDYSIYWARWCNGEREFYDLKSDPHQTVNMAANPGKHKDFKIANRSLRQVMQRANALVMVLKSCTGDSCRDPWGQLHPNGDVNNLIDALNSTYDTFYANQPRVTFTQCEKGYIVASEGPQKFNVYNKATRDVGGGIGSEDDDDEDASLPTLDFSDA
ncbi:sulfatase family protein [Aspergillus undulatus]|uniref:sulfatase family protein n=1 Tax=Aspergillus undulatus TaxID=1810928 RepID=UPI003CCE434A